VVLKATEASSLFCSTIRYKLSNSHMIYLQILIIEKNKINLKNKNKQILQFFTTIVFVLILFIDSNIIKYLKLK
jgi:hypothetical protein